MVKLPAPLEEIRPRLAAAFGARFRGVILYGSRARGDHRPSSDLDLLVLLDGPISLTQDIGAAVDALYPLQLAIDFPIHALPVDVEHYRSEERLFYRNVARDGVLL